MTIYYVTAGPRKNVANPDAPISGWTRSTSKAYHFRSAKRARRIAARMRKATGLAAKVAVL
jgi:metal-dependent amidase/aminoacylase/carboxypeptidase family protein